MRRIALAAAAAALVAALAAPVPAVAAPVRHYPPAAKVAVLHAVPKTPVDVYVGRVRVLDDFQPGHLSPVLKLKPGTYTIRITAATARNAAHPILGPVRYHFVKDGNYTLVAHLTAKGKPALTKYRNDLAPTGRGSGRLTVRHDAAAPAVDVLADGKVVVRNLRNPNQAIRRVPVGTVSAAVALHGTRHPVLGPAALHVRHGVNTIVYAWGSASAGTLAIAVQQVRTR